MNTLISTEPQYIVAIGASAGGLEALTSFFEHTPLDGISYVISPLLSPDFKSRMVEILSRHSNLEVLEGAEGMTVEVNKVYLIPNTKYMGIAEGRLFMLDKEGKVPPHMTVDAFFTSLAAERGSKSIGVVLSGVGTDGSKGAVAIENAGGTVMVQEPSNARFDGMPNATLAISNTRFILPAGALPSAILKFVHQVHPADIEEETPLSKGFISNITGLIKEHFPFDFTDYKTPTLLRRIKRRMAHHHLKEEDLFFAYLQKNPAEIELLISDFLIGVTSFFRDPEAFEVLANEVIPKLIEEKSETDLLKIWVSCCATGEEAYSLAILIREYLLKIKKDLDVKIFATDINKTAIAQAATGVFSVNNVKSLSAERLEKFFDKGEDDYKIKPAIRKMLIFARHDLTKNPPYCDVDLISCRNMLIYIKPALQQHILAKLGFGLRKNGYLFLGSSENISIAKDDYLEISAKWKIFQNTKVRRKVSLDGLFNAPISDLTLKYKEQTRKPEAESAAFVFNRDMTNVIFSESNCSGLIIDQNAKVTQAFGDLSAFLKQERFNFNLQELLPEPLSIAFVASVHKVLNSNQRVRINNIHYVKPGSSESNRVDLIISPFGDRITKIKGMLVLFKQTDAEPFDQPGENFHMETQTKEYISQLEEELSQLKTDLLSSKEYVESSKEAMQAFNEELLSANEEMQSSNEELQSINEELETINTEHKYTIDELTHSNDDLNNYFRSNVNGQLFVDRDILLMKYSPSAVKHINIRKTDIGRPLSNITTNIKFETLIEDIKKVIDNGEVIIQEIESTDGRLYQVMTGPYLRNDNLIYGAIITFFDISDLKKTQHDLDNSNRLLLMATESAEMGTWSMDVNSLELNSSARLKAIFGFLPDENMAYQAAIGQIVKEHQPLALAAVKASFSNGQKLDLEFPLRRFHDGNLRWVRAIGNTTHNNDGKSDYFTGIVHDITDQKLDDLRKNDFIAMASHELKTPLTSLQALIQILASKAKKEENEFFSATLNRANAQSKKMASLINGFLNVSRLESGKIFLNKQPFEFDILLEEIVQEIRITSLNHHISLLPGPKLSVHADRDKIEQVIINLLTNAIKYSAPGTNIQISYSQVNNMLQMSVKDEGMGISPEDSKKLFDRYYRINSSHTKNISGFGIGLYLSAEIIKRHSGKIWVESEKSKGSTFHFSIPMQS